MQGQKLSDRVERKAKIAGMPDEGQSGQSIPSVTTLVPLASVWRRQQANLLVVPHGRHFDPGGFPQFSDREHFS